MGMKDLLLGLALLSGPAVVFAAFGIAGLDVFDGADAPPPAAAVEAGRIAFAENCSHCHGRLAEGTRLGPSLTGHPGGPSRLGDDQFRRAVRSGIAPREPGALGMPALAGVSDADLDRMLVFLRGIELADGTR